MCDLDGCGTQPNMPEIKLKSGERRLFLQGLISLPLASVLAFPDLAQAAADKLEDVTIKLKDGKEVTASIGFPEAEKAPTVILIHEWWGLNDQIKAVAADLVKQGYIALAVDLYGGEVAKNPDKARSLMKSVDKDTATETMSAWADYLKKHEKSNGKVATLGWCFGGGWSLNTSVETTVDATIIYYGRVTQPADKLKSLHGPVLGHFGKLDKNINEEMVAGFEKEMEKAGKKDSLTVHWYDADHAFANPTGSRYDEENAKLAWERSTKFLAEHLA